MMKFTVRFNMDRAKMHELEKRLGMSGVEKQANVLLEEAKSRCPVDTGFLRDSGYVRETDKGYEVGFSAPYAVYVDKMPSSSLHRTCHGGVPHFFSGVVSEYMQGVWGV